MQGVGLARGGRRRGRVGLTISIVVAIGLIGAALAGTAGAVIVKRAHGHRASLALLPGVSPQSVKGSIAARRAAAGKPVGFDQGGNVVYHGGPVVHGITNYAVFWDPAGEISAASRALIDQYFTDVAHDSGTNGNNYAVLQQYTDSTGADVGYQQAFGGELVDTNPFPADGCNHNGSAGFTPGYPASHNCLTDTQLTTELSSYVAAHSLPTGLHTEYFIFTPPRVITCFNPTSTPTTGSCSDNAYCAYHSSAGSNASPLLYADDPFTFEYDPVGHPSAAMKGCQSDGSSTVQEPNANISDIVLKAVGHESRETLSDPLGNAWFDDTNGQELDDKCNATGAGTSPPGGGDPNAFLPVSGTSPTKFTQTYNAHNYYMQSEWSNGANGGAGACAMAPGAGTVTPSFTAPSAQVVGSTVSFDGTASTSTNTLASASWDFGDGTGGSGGTTTHMYSTPGTYHVTLRLTDTLGNAGTVTHDVTVFADAFTLGKVKINKKNGTAKVPVTVPGAGALTMGGKGVVPIHKGKSAKTVAAGTTKLKVKAKGKAAKTLKKNGKVTVKPKITYTPTGGASVSQKKKIKLVRKIKH